MENRTGSDRRRRPTPPLSRYWLVGRRSGERRDANPQSIYVDRYSRREWTLVIFLLALGVWDAVFTVAHLAGGGQEMNPLMRVVVGPGNYGLFVRVKLAVTLSCLLFMLIHIRFRIMRAALPWVVALYLSVLALHVYNALSAVV